MSKLQEKAVLVKLSFSAYTGRKEDRKAESIVMNETGANKKSTKTYKYLLKDHIDAINSELGRLRAWHYGITLPWARGLDILPTKLYFEYVKEYTSFKMRVESLVNDAALKLNEAIREDMDNLKGLYNERDYPTEREFRNKYKVSMEILPIPAAGDFRVSMQNEEVERLSQELEQMKVEKENMMKRDLWERMYEPVKKMADTLKSGKTNFHKTLVLNVEKMCDIMKDLNVTEDEDLESMRSEIEWSLASVGTDELKYDELTRKTTEKRANDILKKMEGYL